MAPARKRALGDSRSSGGWTQAVGLVLKVVGRLGMLLAKGRRPPAASNLRDSFGDA